MYVCMYIVYIYIYIHRNIYIIYVHVCRRNSAAQQQHSPATSRPRLPRRYLGGSPPVAFASHRSGRARLRQS